MEIDFEKRVMFEIKGWLEARREGHNNDDHFDWRFNQLMEEFKDLRPDVAYPEYDYRKEFFS